MANTADIREVKSLRETFQATGSKSYKVEKTESGFCFLVVGGNSYYITEKAQDLTAPGAINKDTVDQYSVGTSYYDGGSIDIVYKGKPRVTLLEEEVDF